MPSLDRFTPAERRLALLLASLALLGHAVRCGRGVSPEIAIWLDGGKDSVIAPGPRRDSGVPAVFGADSSGAPAPSPQAGTSPASPAGEPPSGPGSTPIDPNRATLESFMELPGVGPVLARRILEDRSRNGPYRRAEDLLRVAGIGPATLRRLRPYLRFEETPQRLK